MRLGGNSLSLCISTCTSGWRNSLRSIFSIFSLSVPAFLAVKMSEKGRLNTRGPFKSSLDVTAADILWHDADLVYFKVSTGMRLSYLIWNTKYAAAKNDSNI